MFDYIKKVIEDGQTRTPSSKRWVLVVSTITLCTGFLASVAGLLAGAAVSETVVLGLAGFLAGLAGGSYAYTKGKEVDAARDKKED